MSDTFPVAVALVARDAQASTGHAIRTSAMPLVPVVHPAIDIDLRYASADNISGRPLYDHGQALLHRDAMAALVRAADLAAAQGLRLRVYDAWRPAAAQWRLWQVLPDPAYVADPRVGSMHTRGIAVDLTLADAGGHPLDMGTGFDEMSAASAHGCTTITPQAQRHRAWLAGLMALSGWVHLGSEWWHYNLPDAVRYPLIDDGSQAPRFVDAPAA